MDLKQIIAAWPFLRKLWKWLPGPLKIVALAIAAVIAVKQMFGGDEGGSGGSGSGSGGSVGSGGSGGELQSGSGQKQAS